MILKLLAGTVGVAVIAAALTFWFACPCDRIPGGPLGGDVVSAPVTDWSFANDVPLCQLEVAGPIPWSINLNCMASDGELFVSCARCDGKSWSTWALADPDGRLGLGNRVYPVRLSRITDGATLDRAWQARIDKLGREGTRPDHWWSFQLVSR